MNKYIKLEDAINVCREKQIIEGGAATGIRCPTPNEIINDLSDLPAAEVSKDAISREWVLSQGKYYYNGKGEQEYAIPIGTIKSAPSVIPKPKEGEWVFEEYSDGYYHSECSICNHWFIEDAFLKPYNYCPNCGAKMKGVE